MNSAWLGVIIPVAIALGVAMSQYLTSRRTSSGNVRSSEADVLWESQTKYMEMLRSDKERAEDQRDKLMDLVEEQMMPALGAVTQGQQHLLGMLTELAGQIGKH